MCIRNSYAIQPLYIFLPQYHFLMNDLKAHIKYFKVLTLGTAKESFKGANNSPAVPSLFTVSRIDNRKASREEFEI